MQDMTLDQLISPYVEKYRQLYPCLSCVPVTFHLTNQLSQTVISLRPDYQKHWNVEQLEFMDNLNGQMLLPKELESPIHILLDIQKMVQYTEDNSMTWVGTIAHEITHAIDYYQYARKINLDYYDPLLEVDQHLIFQMWSEYHAKRIGYSFLRNHLNIDIIDECSKIEHILDFELPAQLEASVNNYNETNDAAKQMYSIMHFLGRFSVWCDLFPNIFNTQYIKNLFQYNPWVFKIFDFLYNNDTLEEVCPKFDEMRAVLKENWEFL